jgi:AcrR family transcriptional regulator
LKPVVQPPAPALPARDRILQTAHDLFYSEGVRATGIDRIIAESGVAKLTFYRHFPSKNDLVLAFLDYRHQRWMAWFHESLARHGGTPLALVQAMAEWFASPGFRGCAFLNTSGELGGAVPEVLAITRRHKDDVVAAIEALLPRRKGRHADALALCVAMDGAIVRAAFDADAALALRALRTVVLALVAADTPG